MEPLKHFVLIFITLLITASASLCAALQPTLPQIIGQVVWVKGNLKASLPKAETRSLARRSAVYEHDTLSTDAASTAEIVFTDDSVMSLRESSTVLFDQYRYGKGAAPSHDTFVANVVKGGFRTITGSISKNNPGGYKTTTPVATIGVSGTMYSVYFDSHKKTLAAKLEKGIIFVSNHKGSLTLTKCGSDNRKKGSSTACVDKLYAEVNGFDIAPTAVSQQPSIFNNETPLTSTAYPKPGNGELGGSFCIN